MKLSLSKSDLNHNFKKLPLCINYECKQGTHNIYIISNDNNLLKIKIPLQLIKNEALYLITYRFENIKFTSIESLIESCKTLKQIDLQLIFEWVNYYIYKVIYFYYSRMRKNCLNYI
jgi:hypothetical protein